MARTPLYPRGGDFTSWALNITQRIERDYAELKNDELNIASNVASISADLTAALRSVSICITADIAASEARSRTDFLSNDASLSAVLYAGVTSVAAQSDTDLHSVSGLLSSDIRSTSFVIKQDISSVAADIIAGYYGGMVTPDDLRSVSACIAADLNTLSNSVSLVIASVSAALQTSINSVSNTVSKAFVNMASLDARITSQSGLWTINLNTLSNSVSLVIASVSAALQASINSVSNTVSFLATYVVNVKAPAYGAVGDGAVNDTTAVATALAAAKGKVLYFPAGIYRMESAVTLTGGVTIIGAGMGHTQIRWSTVAATRGIYLFGTAATYNEFHGVRDLSLVTGATNTGAALVLDYSPQIVSLTGSLEITIDRYRIRFSIENVECMGTSMMTAAGATTGWVQGIYSKAAINGNCRNVAVTGVAASDVQAAAGSHGILHEGVPSTGFENGHPVSFSHESCRINFCDVGIGAYNCEGIYISKCDAVACNYGYYAFSENSGPLACFIGNHANCYNVGIFISGMSQIALIGNVVYAVQTHTVGAVPIYVLNAIYGAIEGNTVVALTPTVSAGIVLNSSDYLCISDNFIQGPYVTNGIHFQNLSSNCRGTANHGIALTKLITEDVPGDNRINERIEAGTRQAAISVPGSLVTISFSVAFENQIKSVVANPMNAGAAFGDDWVAINSYSLGGCIVRCNTVSATTTRSIHFMAFGY